MSQWYKRVERWDWIKASNCVLINCLSVVKPNPEHFTTPVTQGAFAVRSINLVPSDLHFLLPPTLPKIIDNSVEVEIDIFIAIESKKFMKILKL